MARVTVTDIQRAVATRYRIPRDMMLSVRRPRRIARPRQIAMFLTREMTTLSLTSIGNAFGRHYSTVIHAVNLVPPRVAKSAKLQADLALLRELIPLIATEREERELRLRAVPLSRERSIWEIAALSQRAAE